MTAGKDGIYKFNPVIWGRAKPVVLNWCYTSRYHQGYIKTLSLEKQLHCGNLNIVWPLCDCIAAATPPCSTTPSHNSGGHLCVRMSVSLVSGRMCVFSRKLLHPVPARMHYTECHSLARENRQKSVGLLNPVNVEQHLIRSALHRAAASVSAT